MTNYIESEFNESDMELMSTMNKYEKILYVLNKCVSNVGLNKYKSNFELFYKFSDLIVKCIKYDIEKKLNN